MKQSSPALRERGDRSHSERWVKAGTSRPLTQNLFPGGEREFEVGA